MELIPGGRRVAGCCGSGATRHPMCFFLFIWHIYAYLIYDSVCIVPSYPLIGENIYIYVWSALNHCARTSQWSEPTPGLLGWQDSSGSDFYFQTPILADDDENDDEHLTCMTFGWNGHCEDSFHERRCVQTQGFQQKCKETSSSDTRWVLCHCSAHFWLKKAKTDQKQHRAVLTCVLQIYLSNCLFRRPSTEPGHALMDKASVLNPSFFVGKFWAQRLCWNWYFRALRKDICKNHLELIYFHVLGMYSWKELSSRKGGRNDIAT